MNKKATIITLGVLIAIIPFTGFPGDVKTAFFVFAGLAIAIASYISKEECGECITKKPNNYKTEKSDDVSTPSDEI